MAGTFRSRRSFWLVCSQKIAKYAVATLLTLAAGIGINTALFTVFTATALKPLPVHRSGVQHKNDQCRQTPVAARSAAALPNSSSKYATCRRVPVGRVHSIMPHACTRRATHPIGLTALHVAVALEAVPRLPTPSDSATPDSGFDAVDDDCGDPRTPVILKNDVRRPHVLSLFTPPPVPTGIRDAIPPGSGWP
jgi:hypothetical protein